MIAIVDYGMGNLRSVQKAFELAGYEAAVTDHHEVIQKAKAIVIPGVGAFYDAMNNLKNKNLVECIMDGIKAGKPFLGICLGMQVLFEYGYEVEKCKGLGILQGDIVKIPAGNKIPHMGWNQLRFNGTCELLEGLKGDEYVYFVHSYYVDTKGKDTVKATAHYGIELPAVVQKDKIFGLQFHPEKSGDIGLKILKNFGQVIK